MSEPELKKIKLSFDDVDTRDIEVIDGAVIYPHEFEEFFENVDDVYKFFDEDMVIAAIVSEDYVYFITFNKPPHFIISTLSLIRVKRVD